MQLKGGLKYFLLVFVSFGIFIAPCFKGELGAQASSLNPYALVKEKFILPNGLTAVVVEKHKLPLVQVQLLVRAGALYEIEEKAGLASLTGRLLDKGTTTKTALELAEGLDLIGANLSVGTGRTATTLGLSVLLKDVDEGLSIFADVLMNPAFREEEIAREKKKVVSEIAQKKDKPESLAREAIQELVYRGHPLRRPVEGYEDSVPGISRDDIRDFYLRYFSPANSILVIVGDLTREEMKGMVEKYFAGWEKRPVQAMKLSPPPEDIGKKVRVLNKDVNQSFINLGMISIRRVDPDYNALRVMNYIMGGGGFVSRLLKRIRAQEGLAYSAYSYVEPGSIFKGFYIFALQTKVASTSQAMNIMIEVMQEMRDNLVTEEELNEAKTFYEGSLVRRMETYSDVAGLIMDQEFYGLPEDFYLKDIEEIKRLTREDIQRVAQKYIQLDNFNVAIVTKAKDLQLDVKGIDQSMIEKEGM